MGNDRVLRARDVYLLKVAKVYGILTPKGLVARMSVEGLPYGKIPKGDWPAVRAFRRLGMDARLRLCQRVIKGLRPGVSEDFGSRDWLYRRLSVADADAFLQTAGRR